MAARSTAQQRGGIGTVCVSTPRALASRRTSSRRAGWLSLSASRLHSRGTDTPNHCEQSSRAPRSSRRICGRPLAAALMAAAAGSQSPTAVIAVGTSPVLSACACATAHCPKVSAAGMERRPSASSAARLRSSCGRADLSSAAWTSAGHTSETTHASPGLAGSRAYPPTPSTPLASVTTVSDPGMSRGGKCRSGARATPSLMSSTSSASSRSSSHSACTGPPPRSWSCGGRRRAPPTTQDARVTAYPPPRWHLISGSACEMLHRRPTSRSAERRSTRPSLARCAASSPALRMDCRLSSGHRSAPPPTASLRSTVKPRAMTGLPTTTLLGAAERPSRLSASTVSCACTCTLVPARAGTAPVDRELRSSMTMSAISGGGATSSFSAAPVKSSMNTCR